MGEHRHNPVAAAAAAGELPPPRSAALPPPALIAQGAALFLSRATAPDGSALVILSARNAIVEAQSPLTADDVDKLIAALQAARADMPGGLVIAHDVPGGANGHRR